MIWKRDSSTGVSVMVAGPGPGMGATQEMQGEATGDSGESGGREHSRAGQAEARPQQVGASSRNHLPTCVRAPSLPSPPDPLQTWLSLHALQETATNSGQGSVPSPSQQPSRRQDLCPVSHPQPCPQLRSPQNREIKEPSKSRMRRN